MVKISDKQKNCRFCFPYMGKSFDEVYCTSNGMQDERIVHVTQDDCEKCKKYKSKYIEYPLTINGIDVEKLNYKDNSCGRLVKIRPCSDDCKGKTYLGIYLGRLPYMVNVSFHEDSERLSVSGVGNPAIFVPELKKIVFGMESWWGYIESEEELKDITDDDIGNQWYVKMLKEMERR